MKKISLFIASLFIAFLSFTPLQVFSLGTNLIANPSVETASGSLPANWSEGNWGTNTTAFTYKNNDGNTGTHSLYINMTKHTNGDAKWYFDNVSVQPSQKYTYSEFYKSNVATEIDAQYTDTTGKVTYVYLSSPAASSTAWKSTSVNFTTPANVRAMTVLHIINKVGWLQTDDFSLASASTASAPTVSLTAPAAGATISGAQTISANATDAVGVAGVQFKVDSTNIGVEDTSAPYSASLDTTALANGNHTISAVARNTSGLTATASESINVQNTVATPPTVSFTAPTANATVSGTQTVTANASDSKGVANVQFKLDGTNLGNPVTASPYSVSWDTTKVANGSHTLSAVATNTSNLTATATETVNVQNVVATPPTVSFTAPAANATVSGTQTISANASDAKGVSNVQFKLDGTNLGSAVTASPYSVSWDTTKVANGNHTLSAVATNTSNLTATATETVNVQNTVTTAQNLIPNPSLETAQDANTPQGWLSSSWGTNTSSFSYLNTGHTGSRSVEVQTTSYTNGAANWYYNDVPVTAGTTYQYSNWYQSNVDTEVDAEVQMSDGTTQYFLLGNVFANTNWTQYKNTFTVPAGAKSMAIYQILAKVGYIVSDDYSLSAYTPVPFNRGLVSITFDDGWTNQYANASPMLMQYGLPATFYIISGELTDQPDYMNAAQVKNLQAAGNEIGSHSVTHPDLTTVSAAQLQNEMQNSQSTLQGVVGAPVTDFAYPYGAYNPTTIAVGKQYYQSQRTVSAGLNTKDNLDLTQLKIYEVDSNVSQAQVQGWVNAAIAQKSWLILVYHEIAVTPTDPTDALYDTQPSDLNAELSYIKNSGETVETVHQAINELSPQL